MVGIGCPTQGIKCGVLVLSTAPQAAALQMFEAQYQGGKTRIWPVGELCHAVAQALAARFNPVAVLGEITGLSRAASGHIYFSLKDAGGQIRCAMFRRSVGLLAFEPSDGELVEVRGSLGVYEARGDLQLVAESITRAGQGAFFEQFLKLKAKLLAEGLFDADRKRGLPLMPRTVGLVTSLKAAALHDVVSTMRRRAPHVAVTLSPAAVQGSGASVEICQALSNLYLLCNTSKGLAHDSSSKSRAPVPEVILLVRGGGAIEDLQAFNDEALARLIAQSPVPIVTGLGHETDFTIADFVADVRAATPTAAAELVSLARADLMGVLEVLQDRLQNSSLRAIDRHAQRLDQSAQRLGRPSMLATRQKFRIDTIEQGLRQGLSNGLAHLQKKELGLGQRFCRAQAQVLRGSADRLDRLGLRLGLLDPSLVLQRGYAWLQEPGGKPITRVGEAFEGQNVQATLADGMVEMRVLAPTKI